MPRPTFADLVIYRDSPEFDRGRWFMVPQHILKALYVCHYTLSHYADDEDRYYVGNWDDDCAKLQATYPDCVFIYS